MPPALTAPCGFTAAGSAMGIQFIGRALDDPRMLNAANLFQAHTHWHKRRPPIG